MNLPAIFNGRVRLMATGASVDQIGHTSTNVDIRSPKILTPLVPLFAAPGDTFRAMATLRSDTPWTGTVTIEPPVGFTTGERATAIDLVQAGEGRAWADLTVGLRFDGRSHLRQYAHHSDRYRPNGRYPRSH